MLLSYIWNTAPLEQALKSWETIFNALGVGAKVGELLSEDRRS